MLLNRFCTLRATLLDDRPYPLQILVFYAAIMLWGILSHPIRVLLNYNIFGVAPQHRYLLTERDLILIAIITPLVETLLFQYMVFNIFSKNKLRRNNMAWYVFASSIFFGISHFYDLGFIFYATGVGVILAYIFVYYSSTRKAFWSAALVHGLVNATISVLVNI